MDRLTILTTTYYPDTELGRRRYEVALKCVDSWFYNFNYKCLNIHAADDGSEFKTKYHSRQERKGIGASLNAGFKASFEGSDIVMYIVDDWNLKDKIDLNPWVNLLLNHKTIGMVRLGPPHPDLTGTIKMFQEGFAIVLDRHNYAYSMRPALYHKRFFDAYGWFKEGISCWECERLYNENFCRTQGPDIVYALHVLWEHIDTLQLGELEPMGVK